MIIKNSVGDILNYIGGFCWLIFGKFFGSIIYILVVILIIYFLDKAFLRPMHKDKWKKISLSYNIDKYILKKKNLDISEDYMGV